MKRLFLLLIIFLTSSSVFATECTDYLVSLCQKENAKKVKIVSKKEHIAEYKQEIGDQFIPYIAYGYGHMKIKGCRKTTISYLCLLDDKCKPIWGYVIPR